jgi:multiple antibiotic resistance protein
VAAKKNAGVLRTKPAPSSRSSSRLGLRLLACRAVGELSFQHYLLGILAVANNVPAIPLYLGLIHGRSPQEQHRLCLIATLTAFVTMLVSMLAGTAILSFFDISISAFRIAGGLLLVSTGFSMMKPATASVEDTSAKGFSQVISVAVIPIGIPLTTGAGTMSTVILYADSLHHQWPLEWKLLGAIVAMTGIIYVSFRRAPLLVHVLGGTGMDVLTKVFGLITLAIGVQFILTGVATTFPGAAAPLS